MGLPATEWTAQISAAAIAGMS